MAATSDATPKAIDDSGSIATRRANEKRRCRSASGTTDSACTNSAPDRAAESAVTFPLWKNNPTSGATASAPSVNSVPLTISEKNAVLAASSIWSGRRINAESMPDSENSVPTPVITDAAA